MSVSVTEKNISAEVDSWVEKNLTAQSETEKRREALSYFQKLGLPTNKHEEYKYTPITRMLEKNFDFSLPNVPPAAVDPGHFLIPGIEANVLVFTDGIFSEAHSRIISPAAELTILPLREAIVTHREVVVRHLSKYADFTTDALTALNTAAWHDGLFVYVPVNTVVEKPIIIHHINSGAEGQVITFTRNLFVVSRSSEVTIIEKLDSPGAVKGFSSVVTEANVEDNAGLNLFFIQNDYGNRFHHEVTQLQQANNSRVNTFTFTLNGKLVRNNLQLSLDGEGIESHMYGLYLLGKDTLADNHTVVDHKKPHSFSNELYKGIMDENAKGVFNGKIYVRPQAQKTNAFQANRNIILGDKASVYTKPQLEIWADDVKCSHGCTSGQLDEEALFYLQTRGINKDIARAMMLYAFAGELLENIKDPALRNYIDTLISERLHKNF